MRVLITGASGSGTTTLGLAFSRARNWAFFDTDHYYWLATRPAYTTKRHPDERFAMLLADLTAADDSVTSGSLMNWGSPIEDAFDLVVFLYLDAHIRVERLRIRENRELGQADPDFLEWAAQYDEGRLEGRSLAKHSAWLTNRRCPVLRLEGDLSVAERLSRTDDCLNALAGS